MAGAKHPTTFQEILEGLNTAQRMAVDQIEGPVLVVAGPGTGKTHVLSARIGRILELSDAGPANILCLTFTDAGVSAMRQRLLDFIGPTAHQLHLFTFHSFCNRVIQDNVSLFGRQQLEPIDDLERIELIRSVLDKLPAEHLMRRMSGGAYFYESYLLRLFQQMKSEGWKPEDMLKEIDAYIESLPERKEFQYQRNRGDMVKGALKQAKYDAAVDRMNKLRAAIPLFQDYQEAMLHKARYDFDDMILWVLDAFKQFPSLLRRYQEQYLYILVDEYQDTNGSQNQILQSLIAYWDQPNVFIVGDDDQSIYEFQGARLKNLIDFYENHSDHLKTIVLQDNYRSAPAILEVAGRLIGHNEKRLISELSSLGLNKQLSAKGAFAEADTPVKLVVYDNPMQEIAGIVNQIEKAIQKGILPDELAVIYAKHRQVEGLQDLLRRKGIPYQTKKSENALDAPIIQRLRLMIEYLDREHRFPGSSDEYLYRILHFKHWGIAPADLIQLSLEYRKGNSDSGFRGWLLQESKNYPSIQKSIELLESCLLEIEQVPLPRWVEFLLNETGLLAAVFEDEERELLLGDIQSFLGFLGHQTRRNPRLSPKGFLDLLQKMDANGLSLPRTPVLPASSGVQLLTAHGSKGLEFQRVFLLDTTRDKWEPRKQGGGFRFSLPDTLTFSGEEDEMEARRRLFYVALTRAKEEIQISYARENEKGKAQSTPRFVEELRGDSFEEVLAEVSDVLMAETKMLLLQKSSYQTDPQFTAERIDALLENFALSVSGLNTYLRCKKSFFYEHLLKVPRMPSMAAAYGTAMHNSLQWLFERMLGHANREFPEVDLLIRCFHAEMDRSRALFDPKQFEQRRILGEKHLRHHYFKGLKNWWRKVKVETDIRQVEWEGIPLQGVIDKVEYLSEKEVRLVDYKTGRYNDKKTKVGTTRKPEGGPYWRQLLFYKLLFELKNPFGPPAKTGQVVYLESDDQDRYHTIELGLDANAMDQVKVLVRDVDQGIRAHDFSSCEDPACTWCNFERDHIHPDLRVSPPEEGLDDYT